MERRHGGSGRASLVRGVVQATARGFGFFCPEDGTGDWFLPQEAMHGAMHGDRVLARAAGGRRGRREGEVAAIEARAWTRLTGTVSGGRILPDEKRICCELLPARGGRKAKEGDRVVAAIVRYPDGTHPAEARIVEVLGRRGTPGVDMLALVRRFGLRDAFPKAVREQADALPQAADGEALAGRLDLRAVTAVTIDGAHSRDFDDAVSLEPLPGGRARLGVHIADVCAYVRPGSALDREARLRGTSVYFADRVLPMLPAALANVVCSLNEGGTG